MEKNWRKGIEQLSDTHLKDFFQLINTAYPSYTIKKGLCITIDSIDNLSKSKYKLSPIPILFALDKDRTLFSRLERLRLSFEDSLTKSLK